MSTWTFRGSGSAPRRRIGLVLVGRSKTDAIRSGVLAPQQFRGRVGAQAQSGRRWLTQTWEREAVTENTVGAALPLIVLVEWRLACAWTPVHRRSQLHTTPESGPTRELAAVSVSCARCVGANVSVSWANKPTRRMFDMWYSIIRRGNRRSISLILNLKCNFLLKHESLLFRFLHKLPC